MTGQAAVVIGVSGGLGGAVAARLRASGEFDVVHGFARSGEGPTHLDLEDEDSIRRAAAAVAAGPAPTLVFVATGVLHNGHAPERSWRTLEADHLMRDYRVNAVGPALVARHFLPMLPKDRRAVFAALSARVGSIGDNRLGGWHSYRASKAALNMILRNLAIELRRSHPLAVVAGLHPGTVDTSLSMPFQGGVAPDRLFTTDIAAGHLLRVIGELEPAKSGGIFAWDGSVVVP